MTSMDLVTNFTPTTLAPRCLALVDAVRARVDEIKIIKDKRPEDSVAVPLWFYQFY